MRFLVFSDLHLHNYKTFGGITINGMNSRATRCLEALDDMFDYAVKNKIDLLVFCGDWFVPRKEIDIFIINAVVAWINKVKKCGIDLIIVQGNHDKYSGDKDGIYVLENLVEQNHVGEFGSIFHTKNGPVDFVSYQDCDFLICPYFETSDSLHKYLDKVVSIKRDNPFILLAHTPVFHAKTPSGYKFPFGFVLDEEVRKYFFAGFFGDNHKYQNLTEDNTHFYSVGSLLQHDFADEGQSRGFLDVIVHDGVVDELKIMDSNMPKFFTVNKDIALGMHADKFNYYRVVCSTILSTDEKKKLEEIFGDNFEIFFKYDDVFEDDETKSVETLAKKDLFEKYMKESCLEGIFTYKGLSLNEKRLTKIGLDFFGDIQ